MRLDESALKAYQAVQEGVAVMDRSDWGRVRMVGDDRIDFLHRMSTNEVRDLVPGLGRQTILTSDVARIIAVVTVYAFPDHLLLMTDVGGAERIVGHLGRYIFFRDHVQLTDVTHETGMLSVWGPGSTALVEEWAAASVAHLAVNDFAEAEVNGVKTVIAPTDDPVAGFNLMVGRADGDAVRDGLIARGAEPMDASVYEVLRIEAGRPRHGHELGAEFNPLEAGLRSIISFQKGCYIGQEVVARLDTYQKVKQHLVGVRLGRLPTGADRPTLISGNSAVGFLTSWTDSPAHGPIALGYVQSKALEPGLVVDVVDGTGKISGQVTDLPFQ